MKWTPAARIRSDGSSPDTISRPESVSAPVRTSTRLTLIDCGVFSDDGHEALASGLKELGYDLSAVHTLLVSHLHPDHVGLAPRIIEETGCRFIMHERADHLDRPRKICLSRVLNAFRLLDPGPLHGEGGLVGFFHAEVGGRKRTAVVSASTDYQQQRRAEQ